MTDDRLTVPVSDRFREAAADWGDNRLMDEDDALETKAEQALLEIEHLVADATEVEFAVEDGAIHHYPSDDLAAFLEKQAGAYGLEPADVLAMHVDLFARAFLEGEETESADPDDPRPW
ncbi:hypothetical protein Htur_2357 [Haloterrigena turkmenica DSM 5511]|uniref:Uncharacterized protein n=1 Tax=Haloterrigena turkmenica (strain ATCC 51198 / DSM 5511 / JCM 9101 / NCIMB 13204 / VKM B-1734 / 4k) TaxID=543526 RepID=D2RV34_HALTV|nr:hypothetical protein [Haloterrigena turkmenica]ADB61235.1 hypothetical protein Htur_2357 [Haloterrigena turkmenica DSM 5511]